MTTPTAVASRRTRRLRSLAIIASAILGTTLATATPALAFTPATHTPVANLYPYSYAGKPLRVVTIVKDDGHPNSVTSFDSRVIWFSHALVRSSWYKAASAAYQLGPNGTSDSLRATDMPTANGNLTVTQLEAKVREWDFTLHLQKKSSVRTIFLVYLPCTPGKTFGSKGVCGHTSFHPGLSIIPADFDPNFSTGDSMAVVLMSTGSTASTTAKVDGATVMASHEVMEAATDTNSGWHLHSSTPSQPFDVSPWVFNEGSKSANTEVMDMSNGSRIREKFSDATHGYNYRYERVFTNSAAQINKDPFVPASPIGYASVSSGSKTSGWVKVASGQKTHHITLTAWSTKKVPDWKLSTKVAAWQGFASTPATTDRCTPVLSKETVNNGSKITLTVTYSGSPSASYWCAIRVKSTTSDPTNNDSSRQWLVGLRFIP